MDYSLQSTGRSKDASESGDDDSIEILDGSTSGEETATATQIADENRGNMILSLDCFDFCTAKKYLLDMAGKLGSLPHATDIPLSCSLAEAGSESYLVKLPDQRSVCDLSVDSYGSWTVQAHDHRNRMESRSQYFVLGRTGNFIRAGPGRRSLPQDQFHVKIVQRKYRHPSAEDFMKHIHFISVSREVTDEVRKELKEKKGIDESWCLISYTWKCQPCDLAVLPHGNSKTRTAFQRTYPSKIKKIFCSFVSNRAEQLWEDYSLQNRSAAGLGLGRVTSNDAENINWRIKAFCNDKVHATHKLIPKLKAFQESQLLESTRACLGMGEFRPKAACVLLQQSVKWSQKGPEEKRKFLNDHYLYYGQDIVESAVSGTNHNVSQLGLSGPYADKLKEAQDAANELLRGNELFENPLDTSVILVRDKQLHEIRRIENEANDSVAYKCSPRCLESKALVYTCRHALAVAGKQGKMYEHLLYIKLEKGEETLVAGASQLRAAGAGAKPGSKRKGRADSGRSQNRTIVRSFPPPHQQVHPPAYSVVFTADRPTDEERRALLTPAPPDFTQPYHNNNKFKVALLPPKSNRKCRSCQVEFPNVPAAQLIPPCDLIITHLEPQPFRGNDGQWRNGRDYDAYIHAKFSCMKNRYPYFWLGRLEVPAQVKSQLLDVHKEKLMQQFGWSD